ncbi:MFS transporter [Cytobacillus depressus]|uniref:MFS transporter n=1 Tax=Cytobacillus depressus TaxID=1602942 RepID=A0A6L3V2I4_9BACI|nr:MFS transporter [Cytobacillus depressus]KAB2330463.1 MFS transporter [Cytobacillus depressus]
MNRTRDKLWTKDFILVSLVNFFLSLVFYLLIVTIGVYAVDKFSASTTQAGLIAGIYIIGTLLGRLIIGRFIEFLGRKRTLYMGLIFFTMVTLLYFVHYGVTFLLITRFLHGAAMGVASTAAGTIVTQVIPDERKGEGIGYYSMGAALATALGPFIGLYMSQYFNFQMIFILCLALGVISLAVSFSLYVPIMKGPQKTVDLKNFKISNFIELKALPIAVITFLSSFCYSGVLSYINFYAIEIDLVKAASFFFLVYSLAVLVSRPITGRLMDVKGANLVLYPAFFILGVGLLLLSFVEKSITLLAAGILIGLGFGNIQSCTQTIAVKLTPTERMGLATSTFFIFLEGGLGFGPYFLGYVIPITGYGILYAILGIAVLAISILYYFLHGKKEFTTREGVNSTISS